MANTTEIKELTKVLTDFKEKMAEYIGGDIEWKKGIDKKLTAIETQTTLTNGKVIALQGVTKDLPELAKEVKSNSSWIQNTNTKVALIAAAAGVIVSILTPLIISFLKNIFTIK
jgi:hypothetical protein